MERINSLAISYPDFQLNQIIDPDQVDLNNAQIVNKINNVITAINEFTQGTTGAGNITISPITEFATAKTVQQALQQIATFAKNLDTETARQFREVVEKNNQQDSKITAIENLNRTQDSRLNIIEDKMAGHAGRISVVEQKNITQDNEINAIKQKNNEQDGRLTTAEGTIRTHTTQIQSINAKDAEQDRRISGIESREELDTVFVKKIEKRVGVNETDIQKLQEDFAQLEGKDPVAELIVARTSGHTQETFRTLGDRLDHNEIPVKTDFTGQLRGAVNFRIVDENTTETWENHVKLGDITAHDESPIAHEVMMAEHELNETSHSDIREKITGLDEKDLELEDKINVLSNDLGYKQTVVSDSGSVNSILQNGKYYIKDLSDMPTSSWSVIDVTNNGGTWDVAQTVHATDQARSYIRYKNGENWKTKEIATTDEVNVLSNERGYITAPKITNFNNCVKNGKYYIYFNGDGVEQNAPRGIVSGENTFAINVTQQQDDLLLQEICCIYGVNKNRKFYRINEFGTWGGWKEVATKGVTDTLFTGAIAEGNIPLSKSATSYSFLRIQANKHGSDSCTADYIAWGSPNSITIGDVGYISMAIGNVQIQVNQTDIKIMSNPNNVNICRVYGIDVRGAR